MAGNPFNFELFEQRHSVPLSLQRFIGEEPAYAPWVQSPASKRGHVGFRCRPITAPYDNLNSKDWPFNKNYPDGYRPDNSAASNRASLRVFHSNVAVILELCRNLKHMTKDRPPIADIFDPQDVLATVMELIRTGHQVVDVTTLLGGYRGVLQYEFDAEWSWFIARWDQTQKRVSTWTVGKKPKDQVGIRRSLRVPL